MRSRKKIFFALLSIFLGIPLALILFLFAIGAFLYHTADFLEPKVDVDLANYELVVVNDSLRQCNNASLFLNKHGLWEARVVGDPLERGATYGLMTEDLLKYQEDVFVDQIHEIISSEWWVKFLHKIVIIFNRNMAKHVPSEYLEEIYAMSLSCTNEYKAYGSPYVRQLNYHAAHDIGHVMQQYMLVGCSSFAVWGEESEVDGLIVGRNFDFYVGENFTNNKIVQFMEPSNGYKFVSISWPGMMGVLSGMNEKGLTVTINAGSGTIPTTSAMPISLLTRDILQYTSNIEEAYELAQTYETFVSESILVASTNDGYAAIIEKTPEKIALYEADENRVVCTNHYQSTLFSEDEYNKANIANSDSPYRHKRLNQLLDEFTPIDSYDAVSILRNRHGVDGVDIGLSNEKSINQFIAHHSVVFQPKDLKMWVSTSPWQLGEFVCYDLNKVFSSESPTLKSYATDELNIPADTSLINNEAIKVKLYREQYKKLVRAIDKKMVVSEDFISKFTSNNPEYFQVYNVLGDYMLSQNKKQEAITYWHKALSLEISRVEERDEIMRKIEKYD